MCLRFAIGIYCRGRGLKIACTTLRPGVEFWMVMLPGMPGFVQMARIIMLAAVMLPFGYLIAAAGYQTLGRWSAISTAYAACGALWVVTGMAMMGAGLWVLGSLGRNQIPLWIGGVGAVLSGGSLIAGVVSNVIPCSGPS